MVGETAESVSAPPVREITPCAEKSAPSSDGLSKSTEGKDKDKDPDAEATVQLPVPVDDDEEEDERKDSAVENTKGD